jgi:hypothetical protein
MLDPRLKSFCLVSSFVGREEGVSIVEEYNKLSLHLILLKCYHYLHLMTKSVVKCANQTTNVNFNLDIFNKLQT